VIINPLLNQGVFITHYICATGAAVLMTLILKSLGVEGISGIVGGVVGGVVGALSGTYFSDK
jgi:hypothetical protein